MSTRDWKALAAAATSRRRELGLSQAALVQRKGPSRETVRQLEIGERDNYRGATYSQLDQALEWPLGTAEAVLDGDLTPQEAVMLPQEKRYTATRQVRRPQLRNDTPHLPASIVQALSQAAAELSRLPDPTQAQERALGHVLEALSLVRVPVRPERDSNWP